MNSFYYRYVCELNSTEYPKNALISPESMLFSIKSEKIFKLKICDIFVYWFEDNCGNPDVLLHSSTQNYGKVFSKPASYMMPWHSE